MTESRPDIGGAGAAAAAATTSGGAVATATGNGSGDGAGRQPVKAGPKLGRNEPCWCGSGKKFKRCHGA